MSALKYQNRIRIEARSDAQDAGGQPVDEWILVVTVWANMLQVSGKEFISAARDVSEVTASIVFDIEQGLLPQCVLCIKKQYITSRQYCRI